MSDEANRRSAVSLLGDTLNRRYSTTPPTVTMSHLITLFLRGSWRERLQSFRWEMNQLWRLAGWDSPVTTTWRGILWGWGILISWIILSLVGLATASLALCSLPLHVVRRLIYWLQLRMQSRPDDTSSTSR